MLFRSKEAKAPEVASNPLRETVYKGDTGATSGRHIGVSVTTNRDVAAQYGKVSEFILDASNVIVHNKPVDAIDFINRGGDPGIFKSPLEKINGNELIERVTRFLKEKHGLSSSDSVGKYLNGLGYDAYKMSEQSFVFNKDVLKPKSLAQELTYKGNTYTKQGEQWVNRDTGKVPGKMLQSYLSEIGRAHV